MPSSHQYLYILLLFGLLWLQSCQSKNKDYSFFVAGHTYGAPQRLGVGLHPPFVASFDSLKQYPNLSFGLLAGDIVRKSRDSFWNAVDQQLATLSVPTYFAAGNHDEGHKELYSSRYGKPFYSFTQGKDLFIVLNPGLGGWNIWHDQLDFLQTTLQKAKAYNHIFICLHHVLWYQTKDCNLRPNSLAAKNPEINFWTAVMPLLYATERPVYLFAGDVGANRQATAFSMKKKKKMYA